MSGQVGIGGHLPAAHVNRFEPRFDLLDGLVARERAQRGHIGFRVQQGPEALGAGTGERVLDVERAPEPQYVGRGVRPLDALPPLRRTPVRAVHRMLLVRHISVAAARRIL
jgi:hypothetical protein